MTRDELYANIKRKKSFLCVGLDTDLKKIPEHLLKEEDPIFAFNKAIVDATADYCIAYKPNLAFYESAGLKGMQALYRTIDYIRTNYPDQFIIADAKRGDIGNTSMMYADSFFTEMNVDAVTVAPYMGEDSVSPFQGAADFQYTQDAQGTPLFQKVLAKSLEWGGNADNMMYVVGATRAEMLTDIRSTVPDSFLLVPGIGAQGGSLADVCKYGLNGKCGLIVNSSRAIIYADKTEAFAQVARSKAQEVQQEMAQYL